MIVSWNSELVRILGVFNVSPVVFEWLLLTVHFQAELAIHTHANVSAIRHDVTNTQTVISDTHIIASDTHTLVSDIHRNILQNQGTDNQHHLVSAGF